VAGGSAESGRSVTSKVTAILLACSAGRSLSLSELARAAHLPISTTHRLLGELVARRVLERTPTGEYRIGLPLRMIAAVDPGSSSLLDRARATMRDLASTLGSPVRLGVWNGEVIAQAEFSPGSLPPPDLAVSGRPAHATALGRVLLAFATPDHVGAVLATEGAALEPLRRTLSITRVKRVAVVRDRTNGSSTGGAIAMPVFGPGGDIHAAVEVVIADFRTRLSCARVALVVATGSLSRELATTPAAAT
jgi:DNA-binding IclR family transcriptional regulator